MSKGTATAKAVGTAKITATLKIDGENYSATATLTVKAKDPVVTTEDTYILYPENDVTIFVGGTQTYEVKRIRVTKKDNEQVGEPEITIVTKDFTISSSDTGVATMSEATATDVNWKSAGTTITATPKSGTASGTLSRKLTVKHKFDWGTPSKTTVAPGEEISVPYTTTLEKDLTSEGASASFSSNPCKVTIPSDASDGTLTVYGGKKGINPEAWDSFTVTVKKPADVTSYKLEVTPVNGVGSHYDDLTLKAEFVTMVNGSETKRENVTSKTDCVWSKDWASATMPSKGTIRSGYYNQKTGKFGEKTVNVTATYTFNGKSYSGSASVKFRTTWNVETKVVTRENNGYYEARAEYKCSSSYVKLPVRVSSPFTINFTWRQDGSSATGNTTPWTPSVVIGNEGSQYTEWYAWTEHQANYVTNVAVGNVTTLTKDGKSSFYDDDAKEYYFFR